MNERRAPLDRVKEFADEREGESGMRHLDPAHSFDCRPLRHDQTRGAASGGALQKFPVFDERDLARARALDARDFFNQNSVVADNAPADMRSKFGDGSLYGF